MLTIPSRDSAREKECSSESARRANPGPSTARARERKSRARVRGERSIRDHEQCACARACRACMHNVGYALAESRAPKSAWRLYARCRARVALVPARSLDEESVMPEAVQSEQTAKQPSTSNRSSKNKKSA